MEEEQGAGVTRRVATFMWQIPAVKWLTFRFITVGLIGGSAGVSLAIWCPVPWAGTELSNQTWQYIALAHPEAHWWMLWGLRVAIVLDVMALAYICDLNMRGVLARQIGIWFRDASEEENLEDLPEPPTEDKKGEMMMILGELAKQDGSGSMRKWVKMNFEGMRTNMLVLGSVGGGKTAWLLKPLTRQLAFWHKDNKDAKGRQASAGAIIFDIKGDYHKDVRDCLQDAGRVEDHIVLSSEGEYIFNPFAAADSVDPQKAASTLSSLLQQVFGQSREQFWPASYQTLLRYLIEGSRVAYDYASIIDLAIYGGSDERCRSLVGYAKALVMPEYHDKILVYANLPTNTASVYDSDDTGNITKTIQIDRPEKMKPFMKWLVDNGHCTPAEVASSALFSLPNPAEPTTNDPFYHREVGMNHKYIWFLPVPNDAEIIKYLDEHKMHYIVIDASRRGRAETFIRWYESFWSKADNEIKTKVYQGVYGILQFFDDWTRQEIFSPTMVSWYDVYLNPKHSKKKLLPSFDWLMTNGKWLSVDIPETRHGKFAVVATTLIKQCYLSTALQRTISEKRMKYPHWDYERPCVMICDEAHFFMTIGDSSDSDDGYCTLNRQSNTWAWYAIQAVENLKAKFSDNQEAVKKMIGSIRNIVTLAIGNYESAEYAAQLIGKGLVYRETRSYGESSDEAGYSALEGGYAGQKASVNESIQYGQQIDYLVQPLDIMDLEKGEAWAILFDGNKRRKCRVYLRPYWRRLTMCRAMQRKLGDLGEEDEDEA